MHTVLSSQAAHKTSLTVNASEDYSQFLQSNNANYKLVDYYWQVGEIFKHQGWILHISVVLSQIKQLLQSIVPELLKMNVPFKIAATESLAEDLLNGNLGLAKLGKLICVYPEDDSSAVSVAKRLIRLTEHFIGPNIPTDARLGTNVYSRYGSFNPIIKQDVLGNQERHIYGPSGELVNDQNNIPFQLPKGIDWPFQDIAKPELPEPPKLLNHVYKITDILKPDPRGNVFKGLYITNFFRVKQCVIKQGFVGMSSDHFGRDIQDRLSWQYKLHKELSNKVPLPKVYNLFKDQSSTILIMEFIKGSSLLETISKTNPLSAAWPDLPYPKLATLINYALQISDIIGLLHKSGFVHRDIAPTNFLVDKNNKLYIIDTELAFSLRNLSPDPPFKLGTFGFMSPEQEAVQQPTFSEDIYGFGATLLFLFTNIFPIKFNTKNTTQIENTLLYYTGRSDISNIIAYAVSHNKLRRPSLDTIHSTLQKYAEYMDPKGKSKINPGSSSNISEALLETLKVALKGLTVEPIVIYNNLWYSRQITSDNVTSPKHKEFKPHPGLAEGLSGVLYALARLKNAGITTEACSQQFLIAWNFLNTNYLNQSTEIPPGLYKGTAGIALAISECIKSGMAMDSDQNRAAIKMCLNSSCNNLNLAIGMAGQGFSLIRCRQFLEKELYESLLKRIATALITTQSKNSSWSDWQNRNAPAPTFNSGYDASGILLFLQEYITFFPDDNISKPLSTTLHKLVEKKEIVSNLLKLVTSSQALEVGDGGKGLILTLIKAYALFKDQKFKIVAEKALSNFPRRLSHNNFNQEGGLAGLGELYLEAWQIFQNDEWKLRADWIANVFIHSLFKTEPDIGHWVMDQNNSPTADFLIGNAGIIHFLGRCLKPNKINYRILY